MSFTLLRRVWNKIRNPTSSVGRDLEGNRYFEYPNPNDNFGRPKRVVKYKQGYDMWTYIAGEKRLPVQWSSWLTHTRIHPPTVEELQADLIRQARVKARAAIIDERDRQAVRTISEPQINYNSPPTTERDTTPATTGIEPGVRERQPRDRPSQLSRESRPSPDAPAAVEAQSDQPQAWTPHVARRGTGL
ncbi:hypothetical protein BDW22DRAFT_1352765 [Trametopsis cervina]|nr:hypothetical protein BDW22DRAFT_1352765 [Trametopsis cervina]